MAGPEEGELFADVEQHERMMGGGRNRAQLVAARDCDGRLDSYVTKLPGLCDISSAYPLTYICELLASGLARALQIETPRPKILRFGAAFLAAVPEMPTLPKGQRTPTAKALAGHAITFGSAFVARCTNFVPSLASPSTALRVLCFDVLIDNVDRRASNANLLQQQDKLLVIDHDLAFSFLIPPASPFPNSHLIRQHCCFTQARRARHDFEAIQREISAVTDETLDDVWATVPAPWQAQEQAKIAQIRRVMVERRDTVSTWLPSVLAELAP